ncbi:MAG: DMT family transporter [Planktomarina sp.]
MDIRAILAGLTFALIWSSAFTSTWIVVSQMPPLLALSLRFFISGGLAIALAFALGQKLELTKAQWKATIIFGICQNALYLGLNWMAMQTVEASLAAIIASAMPLIVGTAGWLVFQENLPLQGIIGLIAGALGVILIMGARFQGGADLYGILLCVVGVFSLAAATLAARGVGSGGNLLMVVGLQMWVGTASLIVPGLLFETWDVTWNMRLSIAFIYTVLFPGIVATLIWFWLVRRIGAVKAATYHFLNPFFGVAIAAVILFEGLTTTDIIGVIIISTGIWAVQRARVAKG